ncbi:hypothetical protein LY90DRAFT_663926 [Neocallimastix californiae]|uniref:La-domain-containing protein n=1 Tax=Neocallimastix californiae TaxID=1754190 RepID=A0A1Y2FFL1_9FUNG|nr:hypothetical protein LY90DRAFT_663926 [Neocallimastix californiae]|eukprot:ORY82750.1 hypothetical protein LY90DRAFT_663926 [Neocallimastix californiae]
MDFKELEKKIASQINTYLSDSNLSYDSLLYNYIDKDGWIPIFVFILFKLKGLSTDEAEISKSIRKHCKDLEVSEDGKSVRRKKPIPTEFKDDSKTIYIEHVPSTISIEKIKSAFEEFGKIKAIYFPDVKKRIALDDNNKEVSIVNNSDHKKELPIKFFFITFKKKKSVEMAIEKLNSWIPVTKNNFREIINSEINGFRILRIKTWRKMTKEYIKKRQLQIEKLKQNNQEHIKITKEIEYKPGLIAEFRGVHPETNRHILKKLFDLVSTTSFIDYSPNQTTGYIRYKDANSAKIAESYFSRKKVIQVNGLDVSGTLFSTLKKKFEEEGNFELIHDYEVIRLKILEGDEEQEYWRYINGSIRNKNKALNYNDNINVKEVESIENNHTIFNDEDSNTEYVNIDNKEEKAFEGINNTYKNNSINTGISNLLNSKPINESLKEINHIRFDDSDDKKSNNNNNNNNNNNENNRNKKK